MVQNFCGQRIIQHTNDKFLFSKVECKQTLDQLAWLCTLHHAGQSSNPLGVDLLTRGGVVYLHVEKIPSSTPCQTTGLSPVQSHGSCGTTVYKWGRGSGALSICVRRSS
jgi:hypothetical protein